MKSRRSAREAALQALYQSDVLDDWSESTIEQFFVHFLGERAALEGESSTEQTTDGVTVESEGVDSERLGPKRTEALQCSTQNPEAIEIDAACLDANQQFAHQLAHGVAKNLAEIDAHLNSASTHWSVTRMARVDRNILRLATYEMAFLFDIPCSVSINEGIEVSKRFGGPESPHFINGVLDRVAHDFTDRRPGIVQKKVVN